MANTSLSERRTCRFCDIELQDIVCMDEHMLKIHKKVRKIRCKLCGLKMTGHDAFDFASSVISDDDFFNDRCMLEISVSTVFKKCGKYSFLTTSTKNDFGLSAYGGW